MFLTDSERDSISQCCAFRVT